MKVVQLDECHKNQYVIISPATGQYVVFDERWEFNKDFEKPTFYPSMLMTYPKENPETGHVRDHFFVRNGKIQYLSDCHHEMAGKTVDMVDCDWHEN